MMSEEPVEIDMKEEKIKTSQKKKRKMAKKPQKENEEYTEIKVVAESLSQKFSAKRRRNDDAPTFEIRNAVATIRNSENHDSTVARALDNHLTRIFQWEEPSDCLDSVYCCAFCHQGVQRDGFGELFGPYYAHIQVGKHWPTFLAKKPHSKKVVNLELWMHGDCALWAPGIEMNGPQLTNLNTQMDKFWSQNCDVCKRNGAAIPVENRKNHYLHYRCAKTKGYKLNDRSLKCYP